MWLAGWLVGDRHSIIIYFCQERANWNVTQFESGNGILVMVCYGCIFFIPSVPFAYCMLAISSAARTRTTAMAHFDDGEMQFRCRRCLVTGEL